VARIALSVVVLAACAALAAGGAPASGGKGVVVVPVGAVDAGLVRHVAAELRSQLGIRVRVGERRALPTSLRDRDRGQFAGEDVVSMLERLAEARAGNTAVLGVASVDLYPRTSGWKWEFAHRRGNVGVVSVARMDQRTWGGEPNRGLVLRRLRKYALRYGAILALGKRETADPRSVLYDSILSLDDLDFMETTLAPRRQSVARRRWLDGLERSCQKAGSAWQTVFSGLQSATLPQVPALLSRWAQADAALLDDVASRPSEPRSLRGPLVAALTGRMRYLRTLANPDRPITEADVTRLSSRNAALRATLLEAGSRACASESTD
jgi:predicted Zn-dependent protease